MIDNPSPEYIYTLDLLPEQSPEQNQAAPFYKNLRDGRLTTTRCAGCGLVSWPPRSVCPTCFSDVMEWINLPSTGRVLLATVQMSAAPPGFDLPMVFALLEFTPEVRFIGRVLTDGLDEVIPGVVVELVVHEASRGRVMPAFRPVLAAQHGL